MAIVPYSFNERTIGNGNTETGSKNGLGDVVVMGHYKLLDDVRTTSSNKLLMQSFGSVLGSRHLQASMIPASNLVQRWGHQTISS